jgi:hypothetical protein
MADEQPATPLSGAELAAWLADVESWHRRPEGEFETVSEQPPYLVERTATPLKPLAMAEAFEAGHYAVTGRHLDKTLGENALGIIGVENAGGRAIIQHNWGNISCTPRTWGGPMWQTPTPQSGQPLYFRAYPSHAEGCAAWWRLMYRRAHYPALQQAARGRPDLMVRALYESHYVVGGSPEGYRRNATLFAAQYRREGLFAKAPLSGSDYVGAGAFLAATATTAVIAWRNHQSDRRGAG